MSAILADQCNIALWQGDDFALVIDWVLPVGMDGFDGSSAPKAAIVRNDKDKTLIADIAVTVVSPLKVRANATTTTAPILLDFNIVEAGNVNGDPYIHSSRPEVQVRASKVIVDPSALSNLAIIPALL